VSEHDDLMIARITRELRKPERIDPDFDGRVMAQIRAAHGPGQDRSVWQWLVRPRSVQLSPLGGFALAGAMAATLLLAVSRGEDRPAVEIGERVVAAGPPAAPVVEQSVQFVLRAPAASRVALVGDFNDWDDRATPLRPAAGGLWTVTIPLTAGRYTYTFVVDGKQWIADPAAPPAPPDDFGRPGSVVTIGGSAS
jgi:hypothetical protein